MAESASLQWRRNSREELPKSEIKGSGQEELPHATMPEARGGGHRSYPMPLIPRPGAPGGRSYPTPEARGGCLEDQPQVQGAVAAQAQEGLEELSQVEGQEGWQ